MVRALSDASCREREVTPSFDEVGRIATTLGLSPALFVTLTQETMGSKLALGGPGPDAGLALRRREGRCVFLLTLGSGRPLCGLGALAPHLCHTNPEAPLPVGVSGLAPAPERQAQLEAAWRERVASRPAPLAAETALDGLLSLLADAP